MDYFYANKDELYHARSHKYTRREFKNGRWIYWYDNEKPKRSKTGQYKIRTSSFDMVDLDNTKNGRITGYATYKYVHREPVTMDQLKTSARFKKREFDNAKKKGNQTEINATGRNYAASMQQLGLANQYIRDHKFVNRARKWLKQRKARLNQAKNKAMNKMFSTTKTIKDPKTGKVIKTWTEKGWK